MKKEEKALNILGLISTRKTELYQNLIDELDENELDQEEKEELAERISETNNSVFLTQEEIETGEADPEKTIEDLDLNLKAFLENIGYKDRFNMNERLDYPDLSIGSNRVIGYLEKMENPGRDKLKQKMEEEPGMSPESLDDILEELDKYNIDIVEEIE